MTDNKIHFTTIETDSLCNILSDRAYFRNEAARVTEEAQRADKAWRDELRDYQGLRTALHQILGVEVPVHDELPLNDTQILDSLQGLLRAETLKNGSALSAIDSVDAAGNHRRTITVGGIDISGFMTDVRFNVPDGPADFSGRPLTEQEMAMYAAGAGGRAAAMVVDQALQTVEPAERTAAMVPVDQPPPCQSLGLHNSRVVRCVEHGDHVTHLSDCPDSTTDQRITWTDSQAIPSPWPADHGWEPDPGIDVLHDVNSRNDRCYLRRLGPHVWAWQTTPDGTGPDEVDQVGSDWHSAVTEADGDLVVIRP